MIGTLIDERYRICRLLGSGGMGAVYEAEQLNTHRRIALKLIQTTELASRPEVVQRFQREARAAAAVDTKHIVQVLDTGMDAATGTPYLVMEYLDGEDVQQLLSRLGALPPEVALRIVAQACVGLDRAHAARIVHRDVKPANLFLARRDEEVVVKLLDFGVAKFSDIDSQMGDNAGLTRTGTLLGSPLYMSPEQARGSRDIDHRGDIWSLGVVLYHALSGRTPFQDTRALGELILAICSGPVQPVQDFAPWVSPEVARIVHRALRAEPAQRFQSAGEMLAAIRSIIGPDLRIPQAMLFGVTTLQREQVATRLGTSDMRGLAAAAPGTTQHALAATNRPGRKAVPNWVVFTTLLALAVFVLFGITHWSSARSSAAAVQPTSTPAMVLAPPAANPPAPLPAEPSPEPTVAKTESAPPAASSLPVKAEPPPVPRRPSAGAARRAGTSTDAPAHPEHPSTPPSSTEELFGGRK